MIICEKKLAKNLKIFFYTIISEVVFYSGAPTLKFRVSNIVYILNEFLYIIKNKLLLIILNLKLRYFLYIVLLSLNVIFYYKI